MASTRIPVTVLTHDDRPAYEGDVRACRADGRYEVENRETAEVVAVPKSILRPFDADGYAALARLSAPESALDANFVGAMIEASFPWKLAMAGSDEYEVAEVVCASPDVEIADPNRHDFDIVLVNGQTFRVVVTQQMGP